MTWLGGAALQWIEGEPGEGGDGLNPGSRWRAGDGVLKDFFKDTWFGCRGGKRFWGVGGGRTKGCY